MAPERHRPCLARPIEVPPPLTRPSAAGILHFVFGSARGSVPAWAHCYDSERARADPNTTICGQVVRMISTLHGAWCATLLGTLPSRNRVMPLMPLLPT